MILNFSVGNWRSYKDEASLPLTSTLERRFNETLSGLPKFRSKKAVPVASVYGGNASGKTNLFYGLACLRSLVVNGVGVDDPVPVTPFALDKSCLDEPTVFDLTFMFEGEVYRLVVEATRGGVSYESLEKITERRTFDIYERCDEVEGGYLLNDKFFGNIERTSFVMEGTRINQLFLHEAVDSNVSELLPAFRWFSDVLVLIGVESSAWDFAICCMERKGFLDYASDRLAQLDTGIVRLGGERVDVESIPPYSGKIKRAIDGLEEGQTFVLVGDRVSGDYSFDMYTISREDGELIAERLKTYHLGSDGQEVSFPLGAESSGTKRMLQLLPMMFDLSGRDGSAGEKVYVVDELDRCLHTMLTTKLIEDFLGTCGKDARKQLLFTTHDLLLMDQSLMRRDEMFIAMRGADGSSRLTALSDIRDLRYDKDLVRSYLDGRFGGVPMFGSS